jgi:hypothetical protein
VFQEQQLQRMKSIHDPELLVIVCQGYMIPSLQKVLRNAQMDHARHEISFSDQDDQNAMIMMWTIRVVDSDDKSLSDISDNDNYCLSRQPQQQSFPARLLADEIANQEYSDTTKSSSAILSVLARNSSINIAKLDTSCNPPS